VNAVATPPRASRLGRLLALVGIRPAAPALPVAQIAPVSLPRGDGGPPLVSSSRGRRPRPESLDPALYTPAGWSGECDKVVNDPKAAGGLEVRRATAMAAAWVCEPNPSDPNGQAVADEVNRQLGWGTVHRGAGTLKRGWDQLFVELFGVADEKGMSLGEDLYAVVDGKAVLVDIAQRHSANFEAWRYDEAGEVNGAFMVKSALGRQRYVLDLYEAADAAGGGGVHFSFGTDGDPEGRKMAILAACIPWVALKVHMTAKAWDAVSRWALPVIMSVLRTELAQKMGLALNDPLVTQAVEAAGEAASAFLSGEDAALHGSDMVSFEAFGGELDLSQWVALSNEVDNQALTRIGTANLTFGVSATNGSHSAAETISNLLSLTVDSRLTLFGWQFRRQVIGRIVAFNFGPDTPLPIVRHDGLDVDGLAANFGTLPHLMAAFPGLTNSDILDVVAKALGVRLKPGAVAGTPAPLPIGDPGAPGPGRGNEADPNLEPLAVPDVA